jgi:hypothetical protein
MYDIVCMYVCMYVCMHVCMKMYVMSTRASIYQINIMLNEMLGGQWLRRPPPPLATSIPDQNERMVVSMMKVDLATTIAEVNTPINLTSGPENMRLRG